MTQIDEWSQHRGIPQATTVDLAARQRLAVRVITLAALLAALATLVQIYDGISGNGSFWSALIAVGTTAWWITIAVYLSDRRGRQKAEDARS